MSAQTRFSFRLWGVSGHNSMQARGWGRAARLPGWRFLPDLRMARYGHARAGLLKASWRRLDDLGRRHLAWGDFRTGCRRPNRFHSYFVACLQTRPQFDSESRALNARSGQTQPLPSVHASSLRRLQSLHPPFQCPSLSSRNTSMASI